MATILRGVKANTFYNNYFREVHNNGCCSVRDVYKAPSGSKLYAEERILDDMRRIDNTIENAYTINYTVIGYNCMMFSAAYKVIDTKNCNRGIAVIYYTAYNTYIIPLEKFNDYAEEIIKAVRA